MNLYDCFKKEIAAYRRAFPPAPGDSGEAGEVNALARILSKRFRDIAASECEAAGVSFHEVYATPGGLDSWAYSTAEAGHLDFWQSLANLDKEVRETIRGQIEHYQTNHKGGLKRFDMPVYISPELYSTVDTRRMIDEGLRRFKAGDYGDLTDDEAARNAESLKAGAGQIIGCYGSQELTHYIVEPPFYVYGWLVDGKLTGISAVTFEEFLAPEVIDGLRADDDNS